MRSCNMICSSLCGEFMQAEGYIGKGDVEGSLFSYEKGLNNQTKSSAHIFLLSICTVGSTGYRLPSMVYLAILHLFFLLLNNDIHDFPISLTVFVLYSVQNWLKDRNSQICWTGGCLVFSLFDWFLAKGQRTNSNLETLVERGLSQSGKTWNKIAQNWIPVGGN